MPRINSVVSDFSAGEISPYFFGKTTSPVYYKGASQMVNFMPRLQGGFRKRPGSLFVGHTYGPDNVAQLYAIKIGINQSYVLEFTNNRCQVWSFTNGVLNPAPVTSFATTYTTAEIPQLQFAWMFPDVFITHQSHPPARIRYASGPTFTLANINFVSTSFTFTATIVTGSPTMTNIAGVAGQILGISLPLPSAGQSGLWVLTDVTTPANLTASPQTYITQVYPSATASLSIAANSATLNQNAANGSAGDTFLLQQAQIPFQSAGNYPRCVAVAYQRVYFANTTKQPETVWASIVGVWDSGDPLGAAGNMNMNLFEATTYPQPTMITDTSGQPTSNPPGYYNQQQTQNAIVDSDGIEATLTETESELLWIAGSHDLIIGAADGEVVIPANTGTAVGLSPNTISDNQVSRMGSAPIQGSILISGVVFVQLGGYKVMEMNWQGIGNSYDKPVDLSFFSGHLFTGNPITAWDFAQSPDTIAFFLRTDGTMACMHYDPGNGVRSWWQFKTRAGDVITSSAVQTGINGDVLFLSVTRGAFNYIEQLSSPDWTDVRLSCYMDASTQKANAVAFTTVAVDASFNGVTMGVVADGAYIGTAVPVGGVLTLPGGVKANKVTVGLLMVTPTVKTMPIAPDGQYGPGLTDVGTIDHVGLFLFNTLDIQVGTDAQLIANGKIENVFEVTKVQGANPTPYTGQVEPVPIMGTNIRELILDIQSSAPLPCEVTALIAEVTK